MRRHIYIKRAAKVLDGGVRFIHYNLLLFVLVRHAKKIFSNQNISHLWLRRIILFRHCTRVLVFRNFFFFLVFEQLRIRYVPGIC